MTDDTQSYVKWISCLEIWRHIRLRRLRGVQLLEHRWSQTRESRTKSADSSKACSKTKAFKTREVCCNV